MVKTKKLQKNLGKGLLAGALEKPEAMPLSQLFEVLFDSSVVVKYPIF